MSIKYVKIYDLPVVNSIQTNDLFVISLENSPNYDNTYNSYKVDYNHFFAAVKADVASFGKDMSAISIAGKWEFMDGDDNYIKVNNVNSPNSVVNYDYVKRNFMQEYLDKLRNQIYGLNNVTQKLPSYIGQIVITSDIQTETGMRQIYGSSTRWTLVKGRMLFGVGSNLANTSNDFGKCSAGQINMSLGKMGGCSKTKLTQIPKHSHNFAGMSFKKFPKQVVEFDVHTEDHFECIQANRRKVAYGRGAAKGNYLNTFNASVKLDPKHASKTFTFKAEGEIRNNKSSQNAHTNMPPVIAEYIWERTL